MRTARHDLQAHDVGTDQTDRLPKVIRGFEFKGGIKQLQTAA